MTQVQKRKNAATACMLEILDILQWNWMQYCYFKYECGLQYLGLVTKNDPFIIDQISRSKTFWNWWKNRWALREETYIMELNDPERMFHIETRRWMYKALHDPQELAFGLCKCRYDLDEDYAKLINQIQHE